MVKEKVWQSICDMIHIHKGCKGSLFDSFTTLVSAGYSVLHAILWAFKNAMEVDFVFLCSHWRKRT